MQNGFSIAQVAEGCGGLKLGDRVELVANPVPPPKVAGCDEADGS